MLGARDKRRSARTVALAQGLYFMGSGVWPLVHMRSFLAMTGPKTDLWLVRTVGALIAVSGAVLTAAAWRGRVTPEVAALGVGSASVLGAVDAIYVAKATIPPVYLLDLAAEAVLVAAWTTARSGTGRGAAVAPGFAPADIIPV
jgi:hypothetical protein